MIEVKIIDQLTLKDFIIIEVSEETYFGNYAVIDGKEYLTEPMYDLPNHIAIKVQGDFIGKNVTFHD